MNLQEIIDFLTNLKEELNNSKSLHLQLAGRLLSGVIGNLKSELHDQNNRRKGK